MKVTFTAGQRLQTSEVGDFFRLLSTTGPVTVEFYYQGREIAERRDVEAGFAEQFRVAQFDRVDITSATAQTVQWETALGSEIRYDRGAATISGSVDLNAGTLLALEETTNIPKLPGADFQTFAAFVGGTPITVFTPAANVNGAIIWDAEAADLTTGAFSLIAKAGAAPTTLVDGEVIAISNFGPGSSGALSLKRPARIAAGKGLYYIAAAAGSAHQKTARYTLL